MQRIHSVSDSVLRVGGKGLVERAGTKADQGPIIPQTRSIWQKDASVGVANAGELTEQRRQAEQDSDNDAGDCASAEAPALGLCCRCVGQRDAAPLGCHQPEAVDPKPCTARHGPLPLRPLD